MHTKHNVLAKLSEEEVNKLKEIEQEKKAGAILMQELMQKCQENIRATIAKGDNFWRDTCKAHDIIPNDRLFVNPADNTLCEMVDDEGEEISDEELKKILAAANTGEPGDCPTKLPDPIESGFDDPSVKNQ